jgi:hypothetical protein
LFNNTLIAQDKEIVCKGTDTSKWTKCKGSSSSKNGTQYSGDWLDGKLNGYGSFIYRNGDKYQGKFKDSERNGAGIYYFLKDDKFKGHQFEGKYLNDKKSGVGKYTRSNGSYFIDQFKLEENCVNIIPDIRYAEYPKDELFWLKNEMKGLSIFIEREEIFDANETEKINNKLIKEITDFNLKWGRLNENSEYERKIIDFHSKNIIEKFYLPLTNRTVRSF